nr:MULTISPECIES: endonuclease/exonuclease/phosphatase family protein [unclassified Nocardioides]
MRGLDCDVLLLTEVSERLEVSDYAMHLGGHRMAPKRRWAGVLSRRPMTPLPDPHPASAAATVDGWTFCSSILPWRSCGSEPWGEGRHVDKTRAAVDILMRSLPTTGLVWGGDWNHALRGREYSGSMAGRGEITAALSGLGLRAPTADLSHALPRLLTIDHIAVPTGARVTAVAQVEATRSGRRLSDHDAYVVTVDLAPPSAGPVEDPSEPVRTRPH